MPSTRLINSTRPEIGRISKVILEQINTQIKNGLGFLQWIGTMYVINWFDWICENKNWSFIQLDIVDYYPSIFKDHFTLALGFAKEYSDISSNKLYIIMSCRSSVLFYNEEQ